MFGQPCPFVVEVKCYIIACSYKLFVVALSSVSHPTRKNIGHPESVCKKFFALNAFFFCLLFHCYQIGMDCLFIAIIVIIIIIIIIIKALHAIRRRDTLFNCFSKPKCNRRFHVLRPNSKCALWARNMSRWVCYVKMSVLCIKSSIRYVPSQVRVLTMSAQYAKSLLRACPILSLHYATRLPCPFSMADNHLLLSNTRFSLLCTAKTLHFTVVFTGFRDFDLF